MSTLVRVVDDNELPVGCPWAVYRQGADVVMAVKASEASLEVLREARAAAQAAVSSSLSEPVSSSILRIPRARGSELLSTNVVSLSR